MIAGVEGTSSYGAGLTRVLQAAGIEVAEVSRPDRAARRCQGKSDPLDAYAAARAALAGHAAAVPKDASTGALRALLSARRSAVRLRPELLRDNGIRPISDWGPSGRRFEHLLAQGRNRRSCKQHVVRTFFTGIKCSTTITKLTQMRRELTKTSPTTQIAAITYDPGYDLPERLLRYGADRGLTFSDTVHMFRTIVGQPELPSFFALHVGYNGSMVSRHGIELFLVDADLAVSRTWSRIRWQVDDVADAVNSAR